MIFVGVRKAKYYANNDKKTNVIFHNYTTSETFEIFDKLDDEFEREQVILSNGTIVTSTPEQSGKSVSDIGGYVLSYPRNMSLDDPIDYLSENDLISPNWVSIYFTFILYNRNKNNFSLHFPYFIKTPAGQMIPKYEIYTISDYYETGLDYFRLFLEIVYLLIFSFFVYLLVKALLVIFFRKIKKCLNKQSRRLKANPLCFRLIGFDKAANANKDC